MEPTYEVVGPVERFDERDTVFAREALDPDSPEGLAYYADDPHLRTADRQLRRFIEDKLDRSRFTWSRAYYQTVFSALAHLGLPDCVAGVPVPGRLDIAPERGSILIKHLARYLGADLVGMAALKPEWVYSHRGARPFFGGQAPNPPLFEGMPEDYTGRLWGDPIEITHPNAIALAFSQDLDMLRTGPGATSDLEVGRVYARSALVACQVASFIRSLGHEARAHHIRNYCVMAVPVAVDAGLGELARSGHLLTKRYGLNVRLACVTTDMPLVHDAPVDIGAQDFCEKCLKCAANCPAGAIPAGAKTVVRGVRKWQINPERCLSYWSRVGAACMICQVVCPWSKPPTLFHRTIAHVASRVAWVRRSFVYADDLFYGKKYKQKADSGIFAPD